MSRKFIGVDIREESLSAVLLQSGLKNRMIESAVQLPFPASGSFQDNIQTAFIALAEKMDLEGSVTNISIPIHLVTFRNVAVPFSEAKKIRQVLPFELEPRLPFPIEGLVIDFQKIAAHGNETQILAAAADTAAVKPLIDVSAAHRADPELVMTGPYAMGWWLAENAGMPDDWILVDLTSRRCSLACIYRRKICLMRSFPAPLASPEAPDEINRHIRQTMMGMETVLQTGYHPEQIVLSGIDGHSDVMSAYLSEQFGVPVIKADLVAISEVTSSPLMDSPPYAFNNALACALIGAEGFRGGLNLRQGALAAKGRLFEYKPLILRSAVFAAVAVCFAFAGIWSDIFITGKKALAIKQEINAVFKAALPKIQNIVDPVHQLTVEIEALKKQAHAAAFNENYLPAVDMLYHLSRAVPDALDVHLSNLVAGDQSILVSGTTDSFNAVNEMKSQLEKNPLFKIVKINSATMDQGGKRVRFKIRIQL